MAQHDYVIANQSGAAFRSDLNNALSAIVSQNSGSSAPSTTYAYQWWADTTTNLLKQRNAANNAWVTIGTLASTNLGLAPLDSPTFTGTATVPTLTVSTSAGIPLGSAANPTLFFTGDTNTGLYSPGADQLALATGGSGRLYIDSSGRLLVGTSSSSTNDTLVLQGNSAGSTFGAQLRLRRNATISAGSGIGDINFEDGSGNQYAVISGAGDATSGSGDYPGRLVFSVTADGASSPTERMRITNAGNVGIGITSPSDTLHVSGNARFDGGASPYLKFYNGATRLGYVGPLSGNFYVSADSGSLLLQTADTERARIDSSGRLLVGTSSNYTNYRLQIEGTDGVGSGMTLRRSESGSINPPIIDFRKNRSGTLGGNTIVQNGDYLGEINFRGNDGTSDIPAAGIDSMVDGTPGTNNMPGRLVFSTTASGASNTTEALRITKDQVICYNQQTVVAKTASSTLTAAELKSGLITVNNAGSTTTTIPTGSDLEASFSNIYTGMTFEFSIIATGAGSTTIGTNTGISTTGSMSVAGAGRFAVRRTAANTFMIYRLS